LQQAADVLDRWVEDRLRSPAFGEPRLETGTDAGPSDREIERELRSLGYVE
jgi:hypothetical protein